MGGEQVGTGVNPRVYPPRLDKHMQRIIMISVRISYSIICGLQMRYIKACYLWKGSELVLSFYLCSRSPNLERFRGHHAMI